MASATIRVLQLTLIISCAMGLVQRSNVGANLANGDTQNDLRCYLKHKMESVLPQAIEPLSGSGALARWQKCSVVSNSGALLKHEYGIAIDAADSVFRFNDAPVNGFESHVGSRETVRIANSRLPIDVMSKRVPVKPGVSYIFWYDKVSKSIKAVLPATFPQSHFYAIKDELWDVAENTMLDLYNSSWRTIGHPGTSSKVTTGCIGMLIAMSLCQTVEAYEMAPSDAAASSPYNYYEDHKTPATDNTQHSTFESEHDLWAKLSSTSQDHIARTGRAVIPGFSAIDCTTYRVDALHARSMMLMSKAMGAATLETLKAKSYSIFVMSITLGFAILLPFAGSYTYSKWHGQVGNVTGGIGVIDGMQAVGLGVLFVYVSLLIASDTLTSYVAQTHGGHYPWNPAMVVMLVEAMKFLVSLSISGCKARSTPSLAVVEDGNLSVEPMWSLAVAAAIRLFPVAAIYAGNNCLVFFVLANMQLDSYVVWRNTTIFFNAFLWTAVLSRALSVHQWVAVGFLIAGCCLNSLEMDGSMGSILGYPVLIVLASAFLSALAAVLNEATLKSERFKRLGIDGLNCLLYSQTTFMLLASLLGYAAFNGRSVQTELPRLASELDRSAVAIMTMQVTLGLVVSRVLLYSNTVAKTMAGGVREIVQVAIAPLFVKSHLDAISVVSVLWITTAMLTYAAPAETNKDKSKAMTPPAPSAGSHSLC